MLEAKQVPSPAAAEELVRRYARERRVFDLEDLLEMMERWRSGSNEG